MKGLFALLRSGTVKRCRVYFGVLFLLAGIIGTSVRAELTEEEKRQLFLKAREEMRTVPSPTPTETPSPAHKPKPAKHPPKHKKSPTPEPEETAEPTVKAKQPMPPPREHPVSAAPARSATIPSPTPAAPPTVSSPRGSQPEEPGQVIVQKSGYEKPSGFSLIPFHLFGKHYQYLTRSVRYEIDHARVLKRRWQFIIVHNSGTRQGNARIFDYYHRHVRRMVNGLAYHFVIGNGTSTGNGEIEIGDRWRRQINGGHVHSDYLNNISIGICLVGDFNRDQPTSRQLDSCEELIRYLRQRCGKIDAHFAIVRPHREMNPPQWPTDCPGDAFPYGWFRRFQE